MGHYDSCYYGSDTHCRGCGKYLGMGIDEDICGPCQYFETKEKRGKEAAINELIFEIICFYNCYEDIDSAKETFEKAVIDSGIDVDNIINEHIKELKERVRKSTPGYRIKELERRLDELERKQHV